MKQHNFIPWHDITAFELAICIQFIRIQDNMDDDVLNFLGMTKEEFLDIAFEKVGENAQRHFHLTEGIPNIQELDKITIRRTTQWVDK